MIAGPVWDEEEGIEPFSWDKAPERCKNHSHQLLPEIFKFNWTEYNSDFDF